MKLSKKWTTVTTLSKTVALIMFISLPFIGFYVGYNFPRANNLPVTIISKPVSPLDKIASWKTYSNQKYGYSARYPFNLQTNESETSYDQYVGFTLGKDSSGNAYLPNYTITVAKDDFQAKNPASVNFLSADWVNNFYTMNVGYTKSSQSVTFKKLSNMEVAGQSAVVVDVTATGANQKRVFLKKNGYVYMISDFTNSADFQSFLSAFQLTK